MLGPRFSFPPPLLRWYRLGGMAKRGAAMLSVGPFMPAPAFGGLGHATRRDSIGL